MLGSPDGMVLDFSYGPSLGDLDGFLLIISDFDVIRYSGGVFVGW